MSININNWNNFYNKYKINNFLIINLNYIISNSSNGIGVRWKKKLKPYKTNKITIFNSLINFITYKNLPIRFIKQLINTNNIQNDIYTKFT